jgi:hypothetical protein
MDRSDFIFYSISALFILMMLFFINKAYEKNKQIDKKKQREMDLQSIEKLNKMRNK